MRLVYWGLVLTIAGICSLALLGFVAFLENFVVFEKIPPDVFSYFGNSYPKPMPAFYIALMYIARFATFFSLPLAITIEALKERKSEAKGNERGNRRKGRQVL